MLENILPSLRSYCVREPACLAVPLAEAAESQHNN